MWGKVLHSICKIGTRGLPDMYTWALTVYLTCTPPALGPAALGPQGIHIRQTTHARVTNTKYITLRGWIKE